MMHHWLPRFLSCLVVLCLFTLAGCDGSGSRRTVSGKVILPPGMKLADNDSVTIAFIPEAKDVKTPIVDVAKDLTFKTNDTVPGKYKITFAAQAYAGEKGFEQRSAAFERVNKNFSAETTKLSYEVTQDPQQSITIDLAKGTVTKN